MAATSVIAEEPINSAETPINEITENPTEKNTEEIAEDKCGKIPV